MSNWIPKIGIAALIFAAGFSLAGQLRPVISPHLRGRAAAVTPNWDMKNWTIGKPMSLTQALGFRKNLLHPPALKAQLPSHVTHNTPKPKPKARSVRAAGLPKGGTPQANQRLGKVMAARFGWTGAQWMALNNIVMAESGWNQYAQNSGSGAYGIPQALPGSKMASVSPDWRSSAHAQIYWMLLYIRQRYGNPVNAWNFHLANGWY